MSSPPHHAEEPHRARSTAGRGGFLRAAGWAYAMDGGRQLGALAVSFVLAGILGPEVFGTVAMATVYVLFLEMVQRQGMVSAVVQRRDLTPHHVDTAFWMVIAASAAMTGLSVGLAGWWADVNRLPELEPIIWGLSALIPLQGLVVVQDALLRRRLEFRLLTIRSVAAVAAGGVTGIAGAVAGWGAWALVGQQVVTALVSLAALWAVADWRPRLRWSTSCARDLLGFSSGSFLSALGVFVHQRADALLIGAFFGPVVVGLYRFGARLVELVVGVAARPLQSLALPELSPHQDDLPEFRLRLRRLMRLNGLLAVPALGLVAGVAGPLIGMLGAEWAPAVDALRVLCFVGIVRVVTMLGGPVFQARGRPHLNAGVAWTAAALSAAAFIVVAVKLGGRAPGDQVLGIALSRLLVYGAMILLVYAATLWLVTRFSIIEALRVYAPAFVVSLVCAATGWWVSEELLSALSAPVVLLLTTLISGALGLGLLLLLDRGLIALAIRVLGRRKARDLAESPLNASSRA